MSDDLEIRYKCRCMAAEEAFKVRQRGPDEGVVAWMEAVVRPSLGRAHTARSPLCVAVSVEYVKVPLPSDDGGRIGDLTKH